MTSVPGSFTFSVVYMTTDAMPSSCGSPPRAQAPSSLSLQQRPFQTWREVVGVASAA